ncbi:hypothetical protein BJF82_14130 [Kytococcus sp. CUA-901]|nr:hypothetical protein BJF82_14130 [Kytococcus sp. CUA-901]
MAGPSASGRSAYPALVLGLRLALDQQSGPHLGRIVVGLVRRERQDQGVEGASYGESRDHFLAGGERDGDSAQLVGPETGSLCHPLTGQAHGEAGRARPVDPGRSPSAHAVVTGRVRAATPATMT